jgi:hypothetical protein
MWRILEVFIDLALGLWCLFYASQPPSMRSTPFSLIYEPHMPLGVLVTYPLEVIVLWSLSLDVLLPTYVEHCIY